MTDLIAKGKKGIFYWLLRILYIVSILGFLYFLIGGLDYYLTPLVGRPRHGLYKILKPGGVRSHGLGILGSVFLISLLAYSLRKRMRLLKNMGSLSNWLNIHIFFGISGPLFIILHSTLKLNGLIAVAFWSMIAVALSGILGRYLYLQIPRNIMGHELSLQEVEELNKNLTIQLHQKFQLEIREIASIESELLTIRRREISLGLLVFDLLAGDLRFLLGGRRIRRQVRRKYLLPPQDIQELFRLLKQKAQIIRRISLWNKIHQLFHYWHVFHKPFALIMYIIMIVHVGISLWLGYRWIF
jgi:hypothetical protein